MDTTTAIGTSVNQIPVNQTPSAELDTATAIGTQADQLQAYQIPPADQLPSAEYLYWKLKELHHMADALLRFQPNDGSTEEFFLTQLASGLEDLRDRCQS